MKGWNFFLPKWNYCIYAQKNRLCSLLTLSSHQITCASNDYCLTGTCCAHAVFIFSHLFQLHMWTIITYIMFQLARQKKMTYALHTRDVAPYIRINVAKWKKSWGKKAPYFTRSPGIIFLRNQKEFAFSFEFLDDASVLRTFWFPLNNKISREERAAVVKLYRSNAEKF